MYLILYSYDSFFKANADSLKDALLLFEEYIGNKSTVFEKDLNAMQTIEEMLILHNRFCDYRINAIYKIRETIYEEQDLY